MGERARGQRSEAASRWGSPLEYRCLSRDSEETPPDARGSVSRRDAGEGAGGGGAGQSVAGDPAGDPLLRRGKLARIGGVDEQRFGLPRGLVRADPGDPSPSAHRRALLKRAVELQQPTDVLVLDREFVLSLPKD